MQIVNCKKCLQFFCRCLKSPSDQELEGIMELTRGPNTKVFQYNYEGTDKFLAERLFMVGCAGSEQYVASKQGDGYIHVEKNETNIGDQPLNRTGWKVHVSINISEDSNQNLESAWDVIAPILMEHGIPSFKVFNGIMSARQPGKEIVIYACDAPGNTPWEEILGAIHRSLIEREVAPGEIPGIRIGNELLDIREPQIGQSPYFYARNDSNNNEQSIRKSFAILGPFANIENLAGSSIQLK